MGVCVLTIGAVAYIATPNQDLYPKVSDLGSSYSGQADLTIYSDIAKALRTPDNATCVGRCSYVD